MEGVSEGDRRPTRVELRSHLDFSVVFSQISAGTPPKIGGFLAPSTSRRLAIKASGFPSPVRSPTAISELNALPQSAVMKAPLAVVQPDLIWRSSPWFATGREDIYAAIAVEVRKGHAVSPPVADALAAIVKVALTIVEIHFGNLIGGHDYRQNKVQVPVAAKVTHRNAVNMGFVLIETLAAVPKIACTAVQPYPVGTRVLAVVFVSPTTDHGVDSAVAIHSAGAMEAITADPGFEPSPSSCPVSRNRPFPSLRKTRMVFHP